MKILTKSNGMTKIELFKLISPKDYTNMREKVGEKLKIKNFAIHEEPEASGIIKKVLAIETESGEVVVTTSRTLIMEFEKIIAVFGAKNVDEITIVESETGFGNDVLSCRYSILENM